MKLPYTVTFQQPPIVRANGEIRSYDPITTDELQITIFDEPQEKLCAVSIVNCQLPLLLWQKESYDAAGDYTQAQVEARVLELLGDDPKSVLESLFNK